ncbi:hypothetical protein BSKO_09806 [Bryopsis sp. KO-2023]|nr:hypothetical protein BSKO_09806 [Bryopsis sp. KO-2023]
MECEPLAIDDLRILDSVGVACWVHSCQNKKNIWANESTLCLFSSTLADFLKLDFDRCPHNLTNVEYERYLVQNTLIQEEVESGGEELDLDVFGHSLLPGVHCAKLHDSTVIHCKGISMKLVDEIVPCTLFQLSAPHDRDRKKKTDGKRNSWVENTPAPGGKLQADILQVIDSIAKEGHVDDSRIRFLKEAITQGPGLDADVGLNLSQLLGGTQRTSFTLIDEDPVKPYTSMVIDSSKNSRPNDQGFPPELLLEMDEVLAAADSWEFDAFQLAKATDGHPLSTLTFWLLQRSGAIKNFDLDEIRLARFLRKVEEGYPNNPYHNKTHAADVVQGIHMLVTQGGLSAVVDDKLCCMSAYLAAAIHDFEHKGFNNDFLIRTGNDLAMQHNDLSPMENHHVSAALKLASLPEYNFWQAIQKPKMVVVRKWLIEMVLATDMKQHFAIMSTFQSRFHVKLRTNYTSSVHRIMEDSFTKISVIQDDADKSLVLQLALKVADIGHIAAPWSTHLTWVKFLEEEFFRQGDAEKRHNLSVSPLMNREKDGITKSQVGFIDIVALPLFQTWTTVFSNSRPMLDAVELNCSKWRELEGKRAE